MAATSKSTQETASEAFKKRYGAQSYSLLTTDQKWDWHSRVYAFERVVLGKDDSEHVSACDPDGEWFNEELVKIAEARLRASREHKSTTFRLTDREIRTRLQWARDHGYQTWNVFLDAVQEGKESVLPYLDWYKAEYAPPGTAGTFKSLGQALGNRT